MILVRTFFLPSEHQQVIVVELVLYSVEMALTTVYGYVFVVFFVLCCTCDWIQSGICFFNHLRISNYYISRISNIHVPWMGHYEFDFTSVFKKGILE